MLFCDARCIFVIVSLGLKVSAMNDDEIPVFTWRIFTFITVEHCSRDVDKDLWRTWNFHHRWDLFNDEIQNVMRENVMDACISTSGLFHSIWSAWPLWSLDQKYESYGLWYGGQCRGIFLGENTSDVILTREHDCAFLRCLFQEIEVETEES